MISSTWGGGGFNVVILEMGVDDLKLEVGVVVRLVWGCLNGRLYFLWRLSRMSLEEEISNFGGHPFGMVITEFFHGALLF